MKLDQRIKSLRTHFRGRINARKQDVKKSDPESVNDRLIELEVSCMADGKLLVMQELMKGHKEISPYIRSQMENMLDTIERLP